MEQAIIAKQREETFSEEEDLVLALMALDREVNNGGYGQFFLNASRRFAPVIVERLRRIGCLETAAVTERAIGARDGADRDAALAACDQDFYKLAEIEASLFRFLEEHRDRIRLAKREVAAPPARQPRPCTLSGARCMPATWPPPASTRHGRLN